jgi:hypothetical protein
MEIDRLSFDHRRLPIWEQTGAESAGSHLTGSLYGCHHCYYQDNEKEGYLHAKTNWQAAYPLEPSGVCIEMTSPKETRKDGHRKQFIIRNYDKE